MCNAVFLTYLKTNEAGLIVVRCVYFYNKRVDTIRETNTMHIFIAIQIIRNFTAHETYHESLKAIFWSF